ncbi:hypothetical protein [Tenacibaculum sp. 190524A05c]|uniref:Uncharacterized protein n=1 Tax=Tenacibaculum platacis TaxID=3137852 RepID=A0ABM9NQV6_9FLAO
MSNNLTAIGFVGEWKDLNGTLITVVPTSFKGNDGYYEVKYSNGRGPFIGSSFSGVYPPVLDVDFTDDGGDKSGQLSENGELIKWNNGTEWGKL